MKKLKQLPLLATSLFSLLILFAGCKEENERLYSECCACSPLQVELDTGRIFVPNVFTPNADSNNDAATFYVGSGIAEINSFTIKNSSGSVLFEIENVTENFNHEGETGWFAYKPGEPLNGETYKGLFDYELTATSITGETGTFSGSICAFVCNDEDQYTWEYNDNCVFGAQHNGKGEADLSLPSSEEGYCF